MIHQVCEATAEIRTARLKIRAEERHLPARQLHDGRFVWAGNVWENGTVIFACQLSFSANKNAFNLFSANG
jgi:hypothetical protein